MSAAGGLVTISGNGQVSCDERLPECTFDGLGTGLQERVGAYRQPLHPLLFGEPSADNSHGGLGERGRDDLATSTALCIFFLFADSGSLVIPSPCQPVKYHRCRGSVPARGSQCSMPVEQASRP
jgi:hypothetical protein